MAQPDYQPPTTASTSVAGAGQAHESAPEALSAPSSAPAKTSRGLLIPAWVAAVSLAVIALVAVVWTVELIRIELQLEQAARSVRDYVNHLGGVFGGTPPSTCPPDQPNC